MERWSGISADYGFLGRSWYFNALHVVPGAHKSLTDGARVISSHGVETNRTELLTSQERALGILISSVDYLDRNNNNDEQAVKTMVDGLADDIIKHHRSQGISRAMVADADFPSLADLIHVSRFPFSTAFGQGAHHT